MDKDVEAKLNERKGEYMALQTFVIALLEAMPPEMQASVAERWPIEAETARVAHLASTVPDAAAAAFESTVANLTELLRPKRRST